MWLPRFAMFGDNNKIFVYTRNSEVYIYDSNGLFEKILKDVSSENLKILAAQRDKIICLNRDANSYYFRSNEINGNSQKLFRVFPKFPKMFYIDGIGGFAVEKNGDIYYSEMYFPKIYKYSKDGMYLDSYCYSNKKFKYLAADIKGRLSMETMKGVANYTRDVVRVVSIDIIMGNKILYQLRYNNKYYFQILDSCGKEMLPEYFEASGMIYKAKENYMLSIIHSENYSKNNNLNPSILLQHISLVKN